MTYSYDYREAAKKPAALNKVLGAIKSIYGITPKGPYVTLDNSVENLQEKLDKLKASVDKAVPRKGKGGTPLLTIRAKGKTPYDGYDVTLAADEGGNLFQRHPTPNEAAGTGRDMW